MYNACVQAQIWAEMDEEFGVGELVQGTLEHQKPQVSATYIRTCIYI